jgi:hypothetical protein
MRVRFGPVHLAHDLPRGHSRAMLASERNALVNEIDAGLGESDKTQGAKTAVP